MKKKIKKSIKQFQHAQLKKAQLKQLKGGDDFVIQEDYLDG